MRNRRTALFLGLAAVLTGSSLWGGDSRSPVSRSDHPDQTFLAEVTPLWRGNAFDKADAVNKAGVEAYRRDEIDIRAVDLLADIFRVIHGEAEDRRNGIWKDLTPHGFLTQKAVLTLHEVSARNEPEKNAPTFDAVLQAVETLRLLVNTPHFTNKGRNFIGGIYEYRSPDESARVGELRNETFGGLEEFLESASPSPHSPISWRVARWICAMNEWPQPPLLPRASLSGMPADRPVIVPAPGEDIGDKLRYTSKDLEYSEDQSMTIQCLSHGSGGDYLFIYRPNGDSLFFVLERGAIQRLGKMLPYKMTSPAYLAPFLDAVARGSWPESEGYDGSTGWMYPSSTSYRFRRLAEGKPFEECGAGYDEEINSPGIRVNEPAFMGHRLANFAAHLSMIADMLREDPTAFSAPPSQ